MTEDTSRLRERLLEKKIKQNNFWSSFETWTNTSYEERRSKFGAVKSALLTGSAFNTVILKHTIRRVGGKMLTTNPKDEIRHFMILVGNSKMIKGGEKGNMTLFSVLAHIFTCIPAYSDEEGPLVDILVDHLKALMIQHIDWSKMSFSVEVFHSVYWSFIKILQLDEEPTTPDDPWEPFKEMMAFASFVTAIIVAMWNGNEEQLHHLEPDYEKKTTIEEYLESMTSNYLFRNFSYVIIAGFWFMAKNRNAGGIVTCCQKCEQDVPKKPEETLEQYRDRVLPYCKQFDGVLEDGIHELVQTDLLEYLQQLRNQNLLPTPPTVKTASTKKRSDAMKLGEKNAENEASSSGTKPSAVQKAGSSSHQKKLKTPSTQKTPIVPDKEKTSDESKAGSSSQMKPDAQEKMQSLSSKKPNTPAEKASTSTKTSFSPPNKLKRKSTKKDSNAAGPSTSVVAPPKPPTPVPTPPPPPLTADDVGLHPPICIEQNNLMKSFHELLELRRREGVKKYDSLYIENLVVNHYEKLHMLGAIVDQFERPKLNADQKKVMNDFKKILPTPVVDDESTEQQAPAQASVQAQQPPIQPPESSPKKAAKSTPKAPAKTTPRGSAAKTKRRN